MYEVTFLPILGSGIAAAVIGYIWFHPRVFGGYWMRHAGISPEMAEKAKRRMPIYGFVGVLAAMLVAYVMNYFGIAWSVYTWQQSLQLGFWCWVGFTAPPMLGMILWEHKPIRYYLITTLYWLVAFCVIALILLY
ncbi:MAG TPA: DUF1761 domain-containing protein [Candidatus Paceibacterota bacterium]|nr:DUF1761 domain-containing protein [Candidatus Paceibacterota bacterium]